MTIKNILGEIRRICFNLVETPIDPQRMDIKVGKGLQFITDPNLYNEIIKYLNAQFPTHRGVLSGELIFVDGVMKGSSPYINVGVDMYLKSINSKHRIATQRDLETNIEMFSGFYEDTGLELGSIDHPNKDQAEYLYNQIKKINSRLKFPIFFDLRDLELGQNLNFNITTQSRYKTADCLNWKDYTSCLQKDDFGLLVAKDNSPARHISARHILAINSGLSRLYFDRDLGLGFYVGNLARSDDNGRVVLVSVEGGAP